MELALPPQHVSDWHAVLHLTVYPEWSRLSAMTYCLSKAHHQVGRDLFTPRILDRPATEWDAVQSLSYGIDLLSARLWPYSD